MQGFKPGSMPAHKQKGGKIKGPGSGASDSIKADIPMRRLAKPEEIAAAVAFLASEAGAYITGETLAINGGLYMK